MAATGETDLSWRHGTMDGPFDRCISWDWPLQITCFHLQIGSAVLMVPVEWALSGDILDRMNDPLDMLAC